MNNLQHRERLRPSRKVAHTAGDMCDADEGDEEEDAAEDGEPKDCRDKVVGKKVVGFEVAAWLGGIRRGAIHGRC